jgi:M6 family metalloprotease-like protein
MKKLIIMLLCLIVFIDGYSAYLKNVPIELKQPNGDIINCFITGDEYYRRLHDKDDYTILQNAKTGFYVYAIKTGDNIILSDFIVGKEDPKSLFIEPGYKLSSPGIQITQESDRKSGLAPSENSTIGVVNNIVISIRFSDQGTTSKTLNDYQGLFSSTSSNSLKYYFNEISNSQLQVEAYFFPNPNGQFILEYQDPHPRAYYIPYNEITNPIGYKPEEYNREEELLKNAVKFVENQITQSNINFDINNDGVIDNIIFIIQGGYDAWGSILWPMSTTLSTPLTTIGSKNVIKYNKQISDGINTRVLCHEFFHILGAPDLYRYWSKEIDPVGSWDLMSTGNGYPLAYMMWKYGKWFNTMPQITNPGTYSLKSVGKSPYACYKIPSPFSSEEFFVVENRKREGLIESQLPLTYDEGLIIYRINSNLSGNSNGPPDEIYIYRPNGTNYQNGDLNLSSFSSESNRLKFSDITNPSCYLTEGEVGGIQISNVLSVGDEIFFTVEDISKLPVPNNFTSSLNQGNISLNWEAPQNTSNILLGYNIYKNGMTGPLNSSLITGLSFNDPLNGTGDLVYNLTAVYDIGQSLPVMSKIQYYPNDYVTEGDSLALVAIYNSTYGPGWINNENWLKTQVKGWHGVEVKDKRVFSIDLRDNNLEGPIPKEIGQLLGLDFLVLGNKISGPIPKEIGQLANLRVMDLGGNRIIGSIPPEVGNLKKMRQLILGWNQLSDSIPKEIGNLSVLGQLNLKGNQLVGSIPKEIGKLANLRSLELEGNKLSGAVPLELNQLAKLGSITIENNMFTSLPDLSVLKNIYLFNVYENFLTFKDLEPNMNIKLIDLPIGGRGVFSYSPQRKLGEEQYIKAEVGHPYTLTVNCGGENSYYQWFLNGEAIGQLHSSPNYTIDPVTMGNNGEYICKVTNSVVVDLVLEYNPIHILGLSVVGILPTKIVTERVIVYPNPSNGTISIEGLPENKNSEVSIYNINGKLVKRSLIFDSHCNIDISEQKPGIYLLVIDNNYVQTIKIIKN